MITLPATAPLAGTLVFGWTDVTLPPGGTFPPKTALTRTLVILG